MPYYGWIRYSWEGLTKAYAFYGLKAREIAVDPILRSKLYCTIWNEDDPLKWQFGCDAGTDSIFKELLSYTPLALLRKNIPLSVFNAVMAFIELVLGIGGKLNVSY